jgi:hypothetical protein
MTIMFRLNIVILICVLVTSCSNKEALTCEKLARQMEADTSKSIWDYGHIPTDTYYCLGKYFAQRDIDKKILLVQAYGDPDAANPCLVCRYKSYGFSFQYHFDIISEEVTKFIEGYNEISKSYLRSKIGDSLFVHLDDIPNEYFDPREVLRKNFNGDSKRLFKTAVINDSTINVKLAVDTLFKDYPEFSTNVVYYINDYALKLKGKEQPQLLDYKQIKETGFKLTEKSNDKYYFKINFDFKVVADKERYCWCASMNEMKYGYIIPLTVKK